MSRRTATRSRPPPLPTVALLIWAYEMHPPAERATWVKERMRATWMASPPSSRRRATATGARWGWLWRSFLWELERRGLLARADRIAGEALIRGLLVQAAA